MSAKVLLVDDSALARRSARRALEAAGYDVVEAEDGLSALERYALERPDVVLLDLVMKGMYGLEVLEKLLVIDPDARVVVLSADVQSSSQELVREAGGIAFLNKPAQPQEIVRTVSDALAGRA
jgi:two-component system chemotaxis response regulator CheY